MSDTRQTAFCRAIVYLDNMSLVGFENYKDFKAHLDEARISMRPYQTFRVEWRVGRLIWHPGEVRYFDPKPKKKVLTNLPFVAQAALPNG